MNGMFYRIVLSALFIAMWAAGAAVTLPEEVRTERNPAKRMDAAVDFANEALDRARTLYQSGDSAKGEQQLDLVSGLADDCYATAQAANKARFWKRAELKIKMLTRRVRALADDLSYNQRTRASDLATHLDEIHDKLLAGIMGK